MFAGVSLLGLLAMMALWQPLFLAALEAARAAAASRQPGFVALAGLSLEHPSPEAARALRAAREALYMAWRWALAAAVMAGLALWAGAWRGARPDRTDGVKGEEGEGWGEADGWGGGLAGWPFVWPPARC